MGFWGLVFAFRMSPFSYGILDIEADRAANEHDYEALHAPQHFLLVVSRNERICQIGLVSFAVFLLH